MSAMEGSQNASGQSEPKILPTWKAGAVLCPPLWKLARLARREISGIPIFSSRPFLRSKQLLTMSLLTAISVKEGEAALEKLPAQVEKMQALLDSKFAYSTLSEVER